MLGRIVTALAATTLAASPCAAQMQEFEDLGALRGGASVGAYFRLPLTSQAGKPPRAQVGLRVSALRSHRDYRSPAAPITARDTFDLRLMGDSKPRLLIAGQPASQLAKERLNLGTAETVAIAVGGVAILLLLAVAASGPGFPDCQPVGGSTDHCID